MCEDPFIAFKEDDEYEIRTEVLKDATVFEYILAHDNKVGEERSQLIGVLVSNLISLGWKLPCFDFDMEKSRDFADEIYYSDLYEINLPMIFQVLQKYYNLNVDENVVNLYDVIVNVAKDDSGEQTFLCEYIDQNMDKFIDMLMLCRVPVLDSEENVLKMIEKANSYHQNSLIKYMDTIISSVSKIYQQLDIKAFPIVNKLIRHKKLAYTTNNIFEYHDLYTDLVENDAEHVLNDLLIEFINGFPEKEIIFPVGQVEDYKNKYEDDNRISALFKKICRSDELSDEKYRSLVVGLNRIWKRNAPPTDLPHEKVNILIEEKIIKMNEDVLPGMRERYPKHLKKYILDNIGDYVNEAINENTFVWQECLMVLRENVADEYKKRLLSFSNESVSVNNDYYSEEMMLYILNNNFDENDLEYIINQNYQDDRLKQKVLEIADEYMEDIFENEYSMKKEFCMCFLNGQIGDLSLSDKKVLLSQCIEHFTREDVSIVLKDLGAEDFASLFDNKNPLIEKTTSNELLLKALQRHNLIGHFSEDEKEKGHYRVYSKRNK